MSSTPVPHPLQPIDLKGRPLLGMFGMSEYEHAIAAIVDYLADDARHLELRPGFDWPALRWRGWTKLFYIDTIPEIDACLFAMLCGSGWISVCHFPKGTFMLSEDARQRIAEKVQTS